MKKVFAALLCILILTGCTSKSSAGGDWLLVSGSGRTSSSENMYFKRDFSAQNGSKYTLCFVDFDTGKQTVVCPKPNCPHTDPDECFALGFGGSGEAVIAHGGRIYWVTVEDKGLSFVHSAKTDGTERRKEAELSAQADTLSLLSAGDKLYIVCSDPAFNEYGSFAEKRGAYLYSYDFGSRKTELAADFSDIFPDWEEYLRVNFKGVFGGKIWFTGNTEKKNRLAATFDLSSGKLKEEDVFPIQIEGGYMITEEDGSAVLTAEDGSEKKFEVMEGDIYGYRVVNGKLFIGAGVYDIETGKLYKNLVSTVFWGPKVYKDGKYLVYDWLDWTFEWLDEDEVVGGEISLLATCVIS